MDNARSFIYIAVMNYLPTMEFSHPRRYCRACGSPHGWEGEGGMGPESRQGAKARGQMAGKPCEKQRRRAREGECRCSGKGRGV